MLDWAGWYTIAVVAIGVIVMARDVMGPDFAMLGMLAFLLAAGDDVVSLKDGLSGFSNSGLLTVAVLFVLASGISETGGLDNFFGKLLGNPSTTATALVRMILPIGFISAFMNNTPVVAIMMPIIMNWCRKAGLAPGQLFMPLSFASILGGTITLIGTSTNLVVAGKQRETFPDEPAIGIFDISVYGIPVALTGCIYIVLFAPRILPGKAKTLTLPGDAEDDAFVIGMSVSPQSPAVGKTLQAAGLRGLDGVYITSVKRGEQVIHAVSHDFMVLEGDVLFFAGALTHVQGLADAHKLRPVVGGYEEEMPTILGKAEARPLAEEEAQYSHTPRTRRAASIDGAATGTAALSNVSFDLGRRDGAEGAATSSRLGRTQSVFPPSRMYTAVVKEGAPDLLSSTLRDVGFRRKFQAAIIGIKREGHRLNGKLGDVTLQAGDQIVLDVAAGFEERGEVMLKNFTSVSQAKGDTGQEFMVAFRVDDQAQLRRTVSSERFSAVAAMTRQMRTGITGGGIAGKTIEGAGLRGLPDVFLVAIERQGVPTLHAVPPTEVLMAGDVLWFAGGTDAVISLRKVPGLKQHDDQIAKLSSHVLDRRLVQVVLARRSSLLDRTVKETQFRRRFDAAIIAVHREGERLRQKIGDVTLQAGDVLLLDTGSHFHANHNTDSNFALVAEVANSRPPRLERGIIAVVCAVAAIGVNIAGVMELFTSALLACGVMLLFGCMSGAAARNAIKWDVILTIAAAFGISKAMETTGAAEEIANVLVKAGDAMGGGAAIQVSVYAATVLLSNTVANNAAAALMFPVAANVAIQKGISVNLMSYLLMLAASASFAVPFGYQTNLMVYGAGGYKFGDFVRFGGPMQIWQGVASVLVILFADQWPAVWAAVGTASFVVFAGPSILARYRARKGRAERDSSSSDLPVLPEEVGPLPDDLGGALRSRDGAFPRTSMV